MTSLAKESKIASLFWSTAKKLAPQPPKIHRYREELEQFCQDSKEVPSPEAYLHTLLRNFECAREKEEKAWLKPAVLYGERRKHLKFCKSFQKPISLLDFYTRLNNYLQNFLDHDLIEDPFFARILLFSDCFESYLIVNDIGLPAAVRQALTDYRFNFLIEYVYQLNINEMGLTAIGVLSDFLLSAELSVKQQGLFIKSLLSLLQSKGGSIACPDLIKILDVLVNVVDHSIVGYEQRLEIVKIILLHLTLEQSSMTLTEYQHWGECLGAILNFCTPQTRKEYIAALLKSLNKAGTAEALEGLINRLVMDNDCYKLIVETLIEKNPLYNVRNLHHPLRNSLPLCRENGIKVVAFLLKESQSESLYNKLLAFKMLFELLKTNPTLINDEQRKMLFLILAETGRSNANPEYLTLFQNGIVSGWITDELWEKLFDSLLKTLKSPQPDVQYRTLGLFAELSHHPSVNDKKSDRILGALIGVYKEDLSHHAVVAAIAKLPLVRDKQWEQLFDSLVNKPNITTLDIKNTMMACRAWNANQRMNQSQFSWMCDFAMNHLDNPEVDIQGDSIHLIHTILAGSRGTELQNQRLLESSLTKLNSQDSYIQISLMELLNTLAPSTKICAQCDTLVPALIKRIDQPPWSSIEPKEILANLMMNPGIGSRELQLINNTLCKIVEKPIMSFGIARALIYALWNSPYKKLENRPIAIQGIMKNYEDTDLFFNYWKLMELLEKNRILDDLLKDLSTPKSVIKILGRFLDSKLTITLSTEIYQKMVRVLLKYPKSNELPIQNYLDRVLGDDPKLNVLISSLCEAAMVHPNRSSFRFHLYAVRKKLHINEIHKTTLPLLGRDPARIVINYYS